MGKPITRRAMIHLAAVASLGALATACGPNAPGAAPAATSAPAPTSAPTSAPAPANSTAKPTAAPQSATPAASAAATTAPAQSASAGGQNASISLINHVAYGPELDKLVFPPGFQIFQGKYGVSVNQTVLPENQQYPVKLLTMVASGTPPDTAFVHPQWLPSLAAKGAIVAIDSYMKDPEVNASDLFPGAMTYYQFPQHAKTFGIPHYSGPCITLFNRSLFKQAGVPAPDEVEKQSGWTWEAARETAVKLTKGSGPTKQFGWDTITSGLHFLDVIIWGFGGDLWDSTMTHCLLGEQKALEALQFYADFEGKYHAVPSAAELAGLEHGKSGLIISGRVAAKYGIKGDVPEIAAWAEKQNVEVGMAPIPKGPNARFVRNGPNSFCLMKGGKNPDACFKLINFMSLDDFQNLQYKVGASIPPRKSQMDSDAFKRSLRPWESYDVWRQAADLDHALPEAATHLDIQNTFSPAWDLVVLGQKSAKDAIAPIIPKIDDLLAQAKKATM